MAIGLVEWEESGRRKHEALLAIDGGGVRGLIPARLLQYLEEQSQRPVADSFKTVAGTSTGGILGAALSVPAESGMPRYKAGEVVDLYAEMAPLLFHRKMLTRIPGSRFARELYSSRRLEELLRDRLGACRLSETASRLLLPTADLLHGQSLVLDSARAKAGLQTDLELVKAVRATSAAPTYFAPVALRGPDGTMMQLADGGLFANNPSELLVRTVRESDPGRAAPVPPVPAGALTGARPLLVVSLGTGSPVKRPATARLQFLRRPRASVAFARTLMDDVLNTFPDERLTRAVVEGLNVRYVRFQADLDGSIPLDKADGPTRKKLIAAADRLIEARRDDLDELAGWLKK